MENRERDRTGRAIPGGASTKAERDAESKAVLDNMAKLKALRLAREAAAPPAPAKARKTAAKAGKPGEKRPTPALSEWLASQQSGGRRT